MWYKTKRRTAEEQRIVMGRSSASWEGNELGKEMGNGG
jgi:hypothetical protein